jgi:hypothetical protein
MPGFPFPGRPGGEHDEPLLDMIIARRVLPPDAPAGMHDLARMLAVLAGPGEPGELAGEAAVRAAFSRSAAPAGVSPAARRPVRHRRSRRSRGSVRSRARLATVMVAAVAGLGSVLAAYSGVLPSPIQQLAHVAVAAPAPPSVSTSQYAASGTRRSPAHKGQPPAGQPAPRPDRAAGTSPAGGQTPTMWPRHKPLSSPSPGHRHPGPVCSAGPWHTYGPTGRASAPPSPPSGSQPLQCTGLPTGQAVRPSTGSYFP